MFNRIILILIGIPILEVLILIKLGEFLGFWTTVLSVIGVGMAGAAIARFEGWRALSNIQNALNKGQMPGEHMVDGLIIFGAGILLVIPGLLTDLAGIFLLIPWTRFFFKRWLRKKFDKMIRNRQSGNSSDIRFFIR